ncbi:MAG: hypothetical protein AAB437_03805 [Patescibacteria group bacterium]
MVKKIFPFFLVFILLLIIFSYYQKNNRVAVKKIFDSKRVETQKSTDKPEKIFLQVDEPKNNIIVNNPIINISGKTIANAFVFINEQELKADSKGNFSITMTLEEGENYILVVASDDFGNSVEKDILVNLETKQ